MQPRVPSADELVYGLATWAGRHPGASLGLLAGGIAFLLTRCPGCFWGTRVPRMNRRTGGRFTGCSNYPHCRCTGR